MITLMNTSKMTTTGTCLAGDQGGLIIGHDIPNY